MNAQRPPVSVLLCRALGAVALLAFPFAVAAVDRWRFAHDTVRLLIGYRPERFLHGEVWTLPLSALIDTTTHHVVVAIGLMFLLLGPYLILAGFPRSIVRFFAGHIGCTLVILVAIVVTSAAGWATATKLYSTTDMGVSAGLAAMGGAFRGACLANASPLDRPAGTGDPLVLLHVPLRLGSGPESHGRHRAPNRVRDRHRDRGALAGAEVARTERRRARRR